MAYAQGIDTVMARTLPKDSKGKAVNESHKMSHVDAMESARGNYIVVLVDNPKKPGSIASRNWGIYGRKGQPTITVAKYMETYPQDDRGVNRARASLLWDWDRRFIAIVTYRAGAWYEVNPVRDDCELPVSTPVATPVATTEKSLEEQAIAL